MMQGLREALRRVSQRVEWEKRATEGGGGEEGLGNNPALDITLPPEAF